MLLDRLGEWYEANMKPEWVAEGRAEGRAEREAEFLDLSISALFGGCASKSITA